MRSFSKPFIFLPIYMYVMNCSWFQQIDFEKDCVMAFITQSLFLFNTNETDIY